MNKYTFSLPNGLLFELTGPSGSTVAQAERIFLEQLAAGSFVGLRAGDTIESIDSLLYKFNLSRLDRGTAGVDDLPLLAIYTGGELAGVGVGLPQTPIGVGSNNVGSAAVPGPLVISSLPSLIDTPINTQIDQADYLIETTVSLPLGPITPQGVQAIVSQIKKNVDQNADQVTIEKGVGKYGFNISQMEKLGLLKPGTGCRFAGIPTGPTSAAQPNPSNFVEVLNSPAVWTGKEGVRSLDDILNNGALQDRLQIRLVNESYEDLLVTGAIQSTATDSNAPTALILGNSTGGISGIGSALSLTAVGGIALKLLSSGGLSNIGLSQIGANISSAFSSVGNSLTGLLDKVNFSSDLSNISLAGITGSISNLANRGVAELGGLLANASKFGVDTATQWAKGLTPDALTSKLNELGKQGQFAINFSDFKIPNLIAGTSPAAAFEKTINRATVDSATMRLIGTTRIQLPTFSPGANIPLSLDSLKGAMNSATSLLKNGSGLIGQATGAIGGLTSNLPSINSITGGLTSNLPSINSITGGVNLIGTSTTDSNVVSSTNSVDLAGQQQAIKELEARKSEYEMLVAQYGRLDSRTESAFTAYQRALANLDNFG